MSVSLVVLGTQIPPWCLPTPLLLVETGYWCRWLLGKTKVSYAMVGGLRERGLCSCGGWQLVCQFEAKTRLAQEKRCGWKDKRFGCFTANNLERYGSLREKWSLLQVSMWQFDTNSAKCPATQLQVDASLLCFNVWLVKLLFWVFLLSSGILAPCVPQFCTVAHHWRNTSTFLYLASHILQRDCTYFTSHIRANSSL